MNRNSKIFLTSLAATFAFMWVINMFNQDLENTFYWNEITKKPDLFLAQVEAVNDGKIITEPVVMENKDEILLVPLETEEEKDIPEPEISAQSALSVLVKKDGSQDVLYQKNVSEELPIASLTKLMTSLIAEELYDYNDVLFVSQTAVNQEEARGMLKVNDQLSLYQLMHLTLIESSNDAAWVLSEGITENDSIDHERFMEIMNIKAKRMGLNNTYFSDPTGLNSYGNYSTSKDLFDLVRYIIENHSDIIDISGKNTHQVLRPDGTFHHYIAGSTNILLSEYPNMIGGKTGYTDEAGGCILTIIENKEGYVVNIVLGASSAETRFQEMRKLIEYCNQVI